MIRFRVTNPLVALACGQFALSMMQVMFMFYYVKVYLNVFHVPQVWFNIAQSLFMVWNAINDPLFGYLQDTPGSWLNSRTAVIRFFAPFLAISFVFMWFPWSTEGNNLEGLHLVLALFLYDAFFSAIGVAWSALFADSTKDPRLRVSAMKYSQISILLSVNIIAVAEKLSHSLENIGTFQVIAIVVGLVGCVCLYAAGSLQPSLPFTRTLESDDSQSLLEDNEKEASPVAHSQTHHQSSFDAALSMTKQVMREWDFIAIVATNFIHVGRSVAHMNFASTATEILIPQSILAKGSLKLSLFYGILTLGPQLLLIFNEKLVVRHGAYRILMTLYAISVASSVLYLFASNAYCLIIFMIIDSITVHSAAPLFNIIISDFIDDDAKRHNRGSGLSSLVFSLNALVVKPAQSLAPVFIVWFLNIYGYSDYLTSKTSSPELITGMLYVLFATPLLLGGLQYIMFRPYSLKNKHHVKAELSDL